jgi:hypothetical protein
MLTIFSSPHLKNTMDKLGATCEDGPRRLVRLRYKPSYSDKPKARISISSNDVFSHLNTLKHAAQL